MGCLTAPFKLLGCLVLVAALALGWYFRGRIVTEARRRLGGREPVAAASIGRPGRRALESARSKIDSMNGWRADSVVLTPAEFASLIGAGLPSALRGRLDSLQVYPRDGALAIRAKLKTDGLPPDLVGPLAIALKPQEPIEAMGPLAVVRPRRGEWTLRSFWIRDVPIPRRIVPKLAAHAFGDSARRTIAVRLPEGVRGIRLRPPGAIVYGTVPGAARP